MKAAEVSHAGWTKEDLSGGASFKRMSGFTYARLRSSEAGHRLNLPRLSFHPPILHSSIGIFTQGPAAKSSGFLGRPGQSV